MFKNKNILVAGGTGLVGIQLVKLLNSLGGHIYVASLDKNSFKKNEVKKFFNLDLKNIDNCLKITKNIDIVFNLLGVTGSPQTNIQRPATFMMSNLYCAINLLYAAQKNNVKRYLYTSTYGVYSHSSVMKEDSVWKTFPSENDKYAGWAKRMGELQVEAYKKEFKFKSLHIVRPANIYGPNMNFNPKSSMVIGSLINKIFSNKKTVEVWGDGKNIRDFIYSKDVAQFMIDVIKKNIQEPINIGSGKGVEIKSIIDILLQSKQLKNKPKIIYNTKMPSGDKKRILDINLAKKNKLINNLTPLTVGLENTISWYLQNKKKLNKRFNFF
jgi:GDP-L-fucose synthase